MITSTHNPRVRALRALRLRKAREKEGRFLAEGIRLVEEALDCGAAVETLLVAPELLVSERARELVRRLPPERQLALGEEAFRSLSERDDPQGIAAVVRIEERGLEELALDGRSLVVAACQVRDPGNLGSIIRTADAAGASAVIVVEPAVDVYDPESVRATMGSLFALPVVRAADEGALAAWWGRARARGLPLMVVGSSAHAQQAHYEVKYRRPVVLLVGNEQLGLSPALREGADALVRLPMAGRATSLNVSAATAALVYEIVRQTGIGGGG